MDRMLYIAADGASQIQKAQAVNANNLANVSTTGFKAQFDMFALLAGVRSGFCQPGSQPGRDVGCGSERGCADAHRSRSGHCRQWQRLDRRPVARWRRRPTPRAGDLRVSATGILETGTGLAVLGDGGPISVPDAQELEIGADGTYQCYRQGRRQQRWRWLAVSNW